MHELWYDCVKPKYDQEANFCYIDTNSFNVYIKTDDIYKDIAGDFETRFHTSNYELNRLLDRRKNEKSIWIKERWSR